jgi:hypothetical protein
VKGDLPEGALRIPFPPNGVRALLHALREHCQTGVILFLQRLSQFHFGSFSTSDTINSNSVNVELNAIIDAAPRNPEKPKRKLTYEHIFVYPRYIHPNRGNLFAENATNLPAKFRYSGN